MQTNRRFLLENTLLLTKEQQFDLFDEKIEKRNKQEKRKLNQNEITGYVF